MCNRDPTITIQALTQPDSGVHTLTSIYTIGNKGHPKHPNPARDPIRVQCPPPIRRV